MDEGLEFVLGLRRGLDGLFPGLELLGVGARKKGHDWGGVFGSAVATPGDGW